MAKSNNLESEFSKNPDEFVVALREQKVFRSYRYGFRSDTIVLILFLALTASAFARSEISNSNAPLPLSTAASSVTLPDGFKATLFAGEPNCRQPIALAFDDRGRLWVAECYTYSDARTNFDLTLHDRIVIYEDSAGSGHFDKRTVFWDKGQRLTSIAIGFGGVFATCAPNLIFIPDRNGDDVPDGPPEILLDGWNDDAIRHNIVNGLKWGPDGWLYGRQGIMASSAVGKPGAKESERTKFDALIWRYHPIRKTFEIFCQGTTNPWGHDWDQYGELWFINTVIGHLWHGIPGAYYKRMYGEHRAPYRYELMDQAADHYHWDTGKTWQQSRDPASGASALGGGHAHCGLMIYLGDNWPAQYYGKIFAINYHGRRVNQDAPERSGSGFTARHDPDFAQFEDSWFRGIDLDYGPDGGVYVLDWSDTGECHENDSDGVHRENGRIYKIAYEGISSASTKDVSKLSDPELIALQLHPNEWFARHARRVMQERAASPGYREKVAPALLEHYEKQTDIPRKLRLLFALHAVGADSESWLTGQLKSSDEHIRAWAIRFLADSAADWPGLIQAFTRSARSDGSSFVRLYLASILQKAPLNLRTELATALLQHEEDARDRNIPLMLWYGIEPIAAQDPGNAIPLATGSKIPLLRQFIARRIGEDIERKPEAVNTLLLASMNLDTAVRVDILRGLAEVLRGGRKEPKPPCWQKFHDVVLKSSDDESIKLVRELGLRFNDPTAIEDARLDALNTSATPAERRAALTQFIEARPSNLASTLETLIDDQTLGAAAGRGLLTLEVAEAWTQVLERWNRFNAEDQAGIVAVMTSRASFADKLLDAVSSNSIPRSTLTAFDARKIQNFNDQKLSSKLTATWGQVKTTSADKKQLTARYRALLDTERFQRADRSRGRELFNKLCAACHKLYGEGAAIGPDLTGGGRSNPDYLFENIVDPSAIVPADYKVSDIELADDSSITALIISKSDRAITIQTPTERRTINRNDIRKIRETNTSLMPEGLLQGLTEQQICNLISYLMAPTQAPLPLTPTK